MGDKKAVSVGVNCPAPVCIGIMFGLAITADGAVTFKEGEEATFTTSSSVFAGSGKENLTSYSLLKFSTSWFVSIAANSLNAVGFDEISLITLSGKLRAALDYVSGTFQGVQVDKIFFQNQNELFDDSAGQQGFYGIAQDYRFNINN